MLDAWILPDGAAAVLRTGRFQVLLRRTETTRCRAAGASAGEMLADV
jgi:hypothetical protein